MSDFPPITVGPDTSVDVERCSDCDHDHLIQITGLTNSVGGDFTFELDVFQAMDIATALISAARDSFYAPCDHDDDEE